MRDQNALDGLRSRLLDRVRTPDHVQDADLAAAVQASGRVIGSQALTELTRNARDELFGAGPLQRILDDPDVTDVMVNGPGHVWMDRGKGMERVDIDIGDAAQVRALAVRLAAAGGGRLDDASPLVDATLPDATRLHAVVSPVCGPGAVISLRVLRTRSFSLDTLASKGTLPAQWVPLVRTLVLSKASMLISGGTGTGKTTLLAALLAVVPVDERIVCVEEAKELVPNHPHIVSLTARRPNIEGMGEVSLVELVRTALRMRPDRIVLGECRGAEVREVLMAMNTGHEGGLATIHANDVTVIPARLEALAALAGMDRAAVAAQAVGGLDIVLHLRRGQGSERGRRFLSQIGMVGRDENGELAVEIAGQWDGDGVPRTGPGWPRLASRWARSRGRR